MLKPLKLVLALLFVALRLQAESVNDIQAMDGENRNRLAAILNGPITPTTVNGVNIANAVKAAVTFIIDGGGAAITTGVKGDIFIPFNCTINSVTMLGDVNGSVVVDIWKKPYALTSPTVANTITASAIPTINSATNSQDATLTGWTTTVTAGDMLRYNVNSATTMTRVSIILGVTKL